MVGGEGFSSDRKLVERVRIHNPETAPNIEPYHQARPTSQDQDSSWRKRILSESGLSGGGEVKEASENKVS